MEVRAASLYRACARRSMLAGKLILLSPAVLPSLKLLTVYDMSAHSSLASLTSSTSFFPAMNQ